MHTELDTVSRNARPLHGVLGWWAVTSFGLLSILVAGLAALWPTSLHTAGATALGAWLLFTACGRFGAGQLLRARYGGPPTLQAGPALLALAGIVLIRLPEADPSVGISVAALSFGIAAAVDGALAQPYPSLARACLRVRAASGLIATLAVAASPAAGLIIAAAVIGIGELVLAVRLLPEVERLAQMLDRTESPAEWLLDDDRA